MRLRPKATDSPPPLKSVVRLPLTNHFGEKVTNETYQGRFLFVYFGYGYCPDICPTELANMAATLDAMGDASAAVQPLFITVDPERDTSEFLSEYVAQFHPNFVGLTGTTAEIASVAKSYRVFYRKGRERRSLRILDGSFRFRLFNGAGWGVLDHVSGRDQSGIGRENDRCVYSEKGNLAPDVQAAKLRKCKKSAMRRQVTVDFRYVT